MYYIMWKGCLQLKCHALMELKSHFATFKCLLLHDPHISMSVELVSENKQAMYANPQ